MAQNKQIGNEGESLACDLLQQEGYQILAVNYRTRIGEIDIVAKDQGYVCFVEVKTRSSVRYGYPEECISVFKQRKLVKLGQWYLQDNRMTAARVRFDVVAILRPRRDVSTIRLIRNAFDASNCW